MRGGFGIACGLLLLSLLPQTSSAYEPAPPPRRPLSNDELVERAVFTSDGIVIASVDSTYDVEWAPDGDPLVEWVAIHPVRWLKGHDPRARLAFWVPKYEWSPALPTGMRPAGKRAPRLIFLESGGNGWHLNASTWIWNEGAVVLPGGAERDVHIHRVESVLRGQSLDSLTMSADLVVVAGRAALPPNAPFADAYYRVERVVAGSTADSVLPVTTPYFIDVLGKDQRLLFLHRWRAPNGTYEVVGSGAGSFTLRGRSVERLGLDINEVVRRVRRLKPSHARTAIMN